MATPPQLPFDFIELSDAIGYLSQRLNDPNNFFWSAEELTVYLQESLRAWNCLTAQWVLDFTATYQSTDPVWQSTANDTNDLLGSNPTSPRNQTLTDEYLYTIAEYHLLEPPTGSTWTGTPQFQISDFSQALQRRRDQVLQISACNVGPFSNSFSLPPGQSRVYLPDNPTVSIMDVRRIRFIQAGTPGTVGGSYTADISATIPNGGAAFFMTYTTPVGMIGASSPGDLFNNFAITEPTAATYVTFYNSALSVLGSTEVSSVSSLTAPAGTAYFLVSLISPGTGGDYAFSLHINGQGFSYTAIPSGGQWETIFSSPNGGVTVGALGQCSAGNDFTVTSGTETGSVPYLAFLDSSLAPLGTFNLSGTPTYAAPAGSAFWWIYGIGTGSYAIIVDLTTSTPALPGIPTTLYREDGLAYEYFEPAFPETNQVPFAWDVIAGPPLAITFDAMASVPNTLDMLTMISGGFITPGMGSPLLIPDDWNWLLKFGMMADVLRKESESQDLERAAYCEKRFQEGLRLIVEMPWLLQARINNVACDTPSVAEMDQYDYEWQSNPNANTVIVRGGIDLFAVSPSIPVNTNVAVTLSMVANAPVPQVSTDPVQVSRDVLDAILDYSQHLATFKEGGKEFADSMVLHDNFLRVAMEQNSRLRESGIFPLELRPPESRQSEADPRFAMEKK
jgi:hypothetical protein